MFSGNGKLNRITKLHGLGLEVPKERRIECLACIINKNPIFEVETENHLLFSCPYYDEERNKLIEAIEQNNKKMKHHELEEYFWNIVFYQGLDMLRLNQISKEESMKCVNVCNLISDYISKIGKKRNNLLSSILSIIGKDNQWHESTNIKRKEDTECVSKKDKIRKITMSKWQNDVSTNMDNDIDTPGSPQGTIVNTMEESKKRISMKNNGKMINERCKKTESIEDMVNIVMGYLAIKVIDNVRKNCNIPKFVCSILNDIKYKSEILKETEGAGYIICNIRRYIGCIIYDKKKETYECIKVVNQTLLHYTSKKDCRIIDSLDLYEIVDTQPNLQFVMVYNKIPDEIQNGCDPVPNNKNENIYKTDWVVTKGKLIKRPSISEPATQVKKRMRMIEERLKDRELYRNEEFTPNKKQKTAAETIYKESKYFEENKKSPLNIMTCDSHGYLSPISEKNPIPNINGTNDNITSWTSKKRRLEEGINSCMKKLRTDVTMNDEQRNSITPNKAESVRHYPPKERRSKHGIVISKSIYKKLFNKDNE